MTDADRSARTNQPEHRLSPASGVPVAIRWSGATRPVRLDSAVAWLGPDRLTAVGTSCCAEYSMSWSLSTTTRWITEALEVSVHGGGWSRTLRLERSPAGRWTARSRETGDPDLLTSGLSDPSSLEGVLDVDLGRCPLTNTMPIRRLNLLAGGKSETMVAVAMVEVPSLRVVRREQVYASGPAGTVRYRSAGRPGGVTLEVDRSGLVTGYPGLVRGARLEPA